MLVTKSQAFPIPLERLQSEKKIRVEIQEEIHIL